MEETNLKKMRGLNENMKLTPAPGHNFTQNPVWISTSIKHSRLFKPRDRKHRFCVAFTIDMNKFAEVFDAKKILDVTDPKAKRTAKKIRDGITSEKFCWFETQDLEEHSYGKVNLGLWEEYVEKFNKCILKSEILEQIEVPGVKKAERMKMYPVVLTENGIGTADPRASVHSETSTRLKK